MRPSPSRSPPCSKNCGRSLRREGLRLFPGTNPASRGDYRSFYIAPPPKAGLPMRDVRTTALRQLVTQAPAPVVADALGFHQTTTTRQFTAAGGIWSRYAATRRPPRTDAGRQQQEGSQ